VDPDCPHVDERCVDPGESVPCLDEILPYRDPSLPHADELLVDARA